MSAMIQFGFCGICGYKWEAMLYKGDFVAVRANCDHLFTINYSSIYKRRPDLLMREQWWKDSLEAVSELVYERVEYNHTSEDRPDKERIPVEWNDSNLTRFYIFSRDKFRCVYCGRSSIEDNVELAADHIFPWRFGGDRIAGNMVTSCKECNGQKRAKIIEGEEYDRIKSIVSGRNSEYGVSNYAPIKGVRYSKQRESNGGNNEQQ